MHKDKGVVLLIENALRKLTPKAVSVIEKAGD